jgi:proteasome accessory factor B
LPGRNSELIRQWTLLRQLTAARTNTIPKLARDLGVSTRTVRRDLEALQAAGFPLQEDSANGTKFWRLPARAMSGLERSGLTFAELSALYLSRALFECFADSHVLADLRGALDKIDAALSPALRRFLDRLPHAISAKSPRAKRLDSRAHAITLRLLEAIVERQVVSMKYDSATSRRLKAYLVHPYRVVHAEGGLYLMAYVPAYAEVRTFAVERIRQAAGEKGTFTPVAELGTDPFANSMGVHRGPTGRVQLRFDAAIAQAVTERTWHRSQQFRHRSDGSVVMTLQVSDDYARRSWILGFGRQVRVLSPPALVDWAIDELESARERYGSEVAGVRPDSDLQPRLPFSLFRLASA